MNELPAHHLRLTRGLHPETDGGEPPALIVNLVSQKEEASIRTQLRPHSTVLDVFYNPSQAPSTSSSTSPLASNIASALQTLFLEEQASIAYLLSHGPSQSSPLRDQSRGLSQILTPELASKLERRQTRSVKYSPTYHITISLFTPTSTPSSWDVETAVQQYLQPLLSSFSISNFTIDTQVQLFAEFAPSFKAPEFDEQRKVWTLSQDALSGFINAAEWPLSPSIGPGLTLNFILYVPDARNTPLVVKETNANSWLIPQWGGVHILNPAVTPAPDALQADHIRPAMLTFSRQLLALLGAPDSPSSLELQIRSMTRVRAATLLLSASSTLGSMARLTQRLHQIPIPENVAMAVDKTLSDLKGACDCLRSGKVNEALRYARNADMESERAFFEMSMVGQVYFPDEHKVAVYLPMLARISVPLITSALKVIKQLRSMPKQTT